MMASTVSQDHDGRQAVADQRSAAGSNGDAVVSFGGNGSGLARHGAIRTTVSSSASAPVIRRPVDVSDDGSGQPAASGSHQIGSTATSPAIGSSLSRKGSGSGAHTSPWTPRSTLRSSLSTPSPWAASTVDRDPWRNTAVATSSDVGYTAHQLGFAPSTKGSTRSGSRAALSSGTFEPPTSRFTSGASTPTSTPVPVIIETVAPGSISGFRVASRPSPLPSRSIISPSASEVDAAGFSASTPLSSNFGWVQQPTTSTAATSAWARGGLGASVEISPASPPPAERSAAVKRFHTLSHPHQDMASGSMTTATSGSPMISGWGSGPEWGSASMSSGNGGMVPSPGSSSLAAGNGSISRGSDLARVLEHEGDESGHGAAEPHAEAGSGLLHRQTSLPTGKVSSAGVATGAVGVVGGSALLASGFGTVRKGTGMHAPAPSTSLSRHSSQKSASNLSRHPSISEEGGPLHGGSQSDIGHGSVSAIGQAASVGRSASLRAGMAREEWRSTPLSPLSSSHNLQYGIGAGDEASRGFGVSELTSAGTIGHHRSHSHSISRFMPSSDLLVSPKSSAGGSMLHEKSFAPGAGLAKSISLRSSPSVGIAGAHHRHSPSDFTGRNLEQQMARARGTPPPQSNAGIMADAPLTLTDGVSRMGNVWRDVKRYQQDMAAGALDLGSDAGIDEGGLLRHKSLQQEYGASRRVQERLERAQALLPTDNRQMADGEKHDGRATSPYDSDLNEQSGPQLWTLPQSDYADLGRASHHANDVEQERLRQAIEAMQLGNAMMSPTLSDAQASASTQADELALQIAMNASLAQQNEELLRGRNINTVDEAYDPLSRRSFSRPSERQSSTGTDEADLSYAQYHLPQPLLGQLGHASPSAQPGPLGAAREPNMAEILRQQHFDLLRQQQGLQAAAASYGVVLPDYAMQVPNAGMSSMFYGDHAGRLAQTPSMPNVSRAAPPAPTYTNTGWQAHNPTQPPSIGRGATAIPQEIASAAAQEVRDMIERRNINPISFDCDPAGARFFVIKSFTEDDVQKSLKHEIWASTTYGNQRLDKAFEEATGPVYLFFSVNGSGHFCGVAQMTSRVDYNTTSDVWAQDKWKGIFHVRWIYVKDIPNAVLRHIRLMNTQEQKPITNSRDTQELLRDAGVEVLRIFVAFKQRTSLLEDFGFYEMQSAQRAGVGPEANSGRTPYQGATSSAPYGNNNNNKFVKTFHHSTGPPSMGPQGPQGARFRVLGGSMNGQGGLRGGLA